jgi:hypothetical protein
MNRTEAAYQSQLDLKSYPTSQLRNLATFLGLPNDLPEDDLAWVIALTLLTKYRRAQMPVSIDWGKFADQLRQINAMYNDIAERFQTFADEAGLGSAKDRHFDGESFIEYAINHDITDRSVDEIYEHMIMQKLQADLVLLEEARPVKKYPISKSGKQCTSECDLNPHNDCICQTDPYSGWLGTFTWDYCNTMDCARRTIVDV